MAIAPRTRYPGQTLAGDPGYPHGKARNITVAGDGTGTPLEADLVNDIFGMEQDLLDKASIVPSGTPDAVGASQYGQSVDMIARQAAHRIAIANHAAFNPTATGMVVRGGCAGVAGIAGPIFLFCGNLSGAATFLFSAGESWGTIAAGGIGAQMNDVIYTGTRWVAVGLDHVGYAAAGVPGSWTNVALPSPIGGGIFFLTSICKHGSRLVAVGWEGSGASDIITSDDDGSTWVTRSPANATDVILGVASNGTRLVAVGTNAALTTPVIWSSDDGGVTWVVRSPGAGTVGVNLRKAIWNGFQFVSIGDREIHLSRDGITWTRVALPATLSSAVFYTAFWTGALVVAIGPGGVIATARANGKEWTKVSPKDLGTADIFSAAFSNEINVAIIVKDGIIARRSLYV